MVEDPDAMWKPGYTAPAADHHGGGPADGEPAPRRGLPDRFRPAATPRRARRADSLSTVRTARTSRPIPIAGSEGSGGRGVGGRPVADAPRGDSAAWLVEHAPEPSSASGRRRPRVASRVASALAVIAALAVAAVVATSLLGDDSAPPRRPAPGEVAGADERRLPTEVDRLWSTVLPGTGNALSSTVFVDGRDLVVAVVDDGSRNRSMIAGIDATSGAPRWRRSFSFAPPEVSLLGVIDGVVLVEQRDLAGPRLIGLASVDGATLWERETPGGSVNTVLLGTDVVSNLSATVNGLITFVDPRTGQPVGDVVGESLSTDLAGTWYFAWGSSIVSIDLANGWSEPVVVVGDRSASDELVVIDGRLLAAGADGRVSELTGASTGRAVAGADDLPSVDSMFPAGGSSFVGLGGGQVFGAELVDDRVRTTWTRAAALRGFALTERGLVLSLSDATAGFADGVDLVVVDGVTGDRLGGAGAGGEPAELPLIVGDGFVTVTEGVDGVARLGHDLDGAEMWRLPVAGKLRVGDGLIVVMDNTPSGFRLTAYGSAG